MSKIICIIGKSGSGKDTIMREVLKTLGDNIKRIVQHTTRPKRAGEVNGREYFFITNKEYNQLVDEGKVITSKSYETCNGMYRYLTVDPTAESDNSVFITVATPDTVSNFQERYGEENVFVIEIKVPDKTLLTRMINRESREKTPNYSEVCRRFLSDAKDFSALPKWKNYCIVINDEPLQEVVKTVSYLIRSDVLG